MEVALFYFSGTGNTHFVTQQIQNNFLEHNHSCKIIPVENITLKKQKLEIDNYNLIGIGFPVHAFNAPRIIHEFIKLLPPLRKNYFLYKTAGDFFIYGGSTNQVRFNLANLGWRCLHESFFFIPPNVAAKKNHPKVKALCKLAMKHAQSEAKKIINGEYSLLPDKPIQRIFMQMSKAENFGAHIESHRWKVNSNCIRCGKCVLECPTHNISMQEGKFYFGHKCFFCMRCSFNCPVQAFSHKSFGTIFMVKPYNIEKILADPSIPDDYYSNPQTKDAVKGNLYFKSIGLL